ncbi:S8 family serine peptidase [Halosolutus gelatinilyticus]|uniref:S8 family serine peptidase n=1 Tax=Halosolutus gelatinilyticus TaxID=2931975 RepID=UPI001FF26B20|nr:S8 family peptidase [Halosolutus gelatinilyticus]
MKRDDLSRRTVLRGVGSGVAGGALVGTAAAEPDGDGTEYVVGLDLDRSADDVRAAADSVRTELDFGQIGRAIAGRFPDAAIEALRDHPSVRYVERNGRMQAIQQQSSDSVDRVEADDAIESGETGDGVSVAILDTGVDPQHETLAGNLGDGYAAADAACSTSCGGWFGGGGNGIGSCLEEWDDDNDHGTHNAGIVGAADNGVGVRGVAPDATLHPVKVLGCDASGTYDDVAAGIKWSADQGHDVQNISLGAHTDTNVVRDAVQYAAERGVVMVAAAGNGGPCSDCVTYPAAYDEVIAVTAIDQNDRLADFSATGPEVDLVAPGVGIRSTVPRDDYADYSGTSMASPHVAGAAATLLGAGYDSDEVRSRLKAAADDLGLDETEQGAGRLNVAKALDADGNTDEPDGNEDDGDDESSEGDDGESSEDDGDDESSEDDGGNDDPSDSSEDEENQADTGSDPKVDRVASNEKEFGPWTWVNVDWRVSDDGDLATVTTELLAGTTVQDGKMSSVGGSTATGEHTLRPRSGTDQVRLTVTDADGNETTETRPY